MIILQGEISQLKFRLEDKFSEFLPLSLFQSWLDGNWFGLCQQLVASKYFHLWSEGVQGEYWQRQQWLILFISRQSMFSTSWLLSMWWRKVRISADGQVDHSSLSCFRRTVLPAVNPCYLPVCHEVGRDSKFYNYNSYKLSIRFESYPLDKHVCKFRLGSSSYNDEQVTSTYIHCTVPGNMI